MANAQARGKREGLTLPASDPLPLPPQRYDSAFRRFLPFAAFGLAFVVSRIILAAITFAPEVDTVRYFALADRWMAGDFLAALHHPYHPLYPFALGAWTRIFPWPEAAGHVLSIMASLATAVPLYLIARDFAGRRAGLICLFLFGLTPAPFRLSAAVLSEPLFLLFFAWQVRAALQAVRGGSWRSYWVAGLFGGLAYLVRPEGPLPLIAMLVAGLWPVRGAGVFTATRALPRFALAAAAFLLLAGPYMAAIGGYTSKKRISRMAAASVEESSNGFLPDVRTAPIHAPSLDRIETVGVDPSVAKRQKPLTNVPGRVAWLLIRAGHFVIMPLFLLGAWVRWRSGPRDRRAVLLFASLLVGQAALLCMLGFAYRYLSLRHAIPITVMLLPLASTGVLALWGYASGLRGGRAVAIGGAVALSILFLTQDFRPVRYPRRYVRDVGKWFARHGAPPALLSTDPRFSFYAGGAFVHLGRMGYEEMLAAARAKRLTHLVDTRRHIERTVPDFFARLDRRLEKVETGFEDAYGGTDEILVYRFRDDS